MSRIDELIKEKCPNGVEYSKIKDVADLYYGKGNNIPKDGGQYPVYGCYGIVGNTSMYNNENTPIVGHIGSAGKVSWGQGKHYVTYNGTICKPKNNNLNSRYLYHILMSLHLEKYVKGSQPFLSVSDFNNVKIPVPPIEVQEEIVRILDKFSELENELENELEARKKQYEFWNKKLYQFTNDIKYFPIEQVCNFLVGGDIPKDNFSKNKTDIFSIPIYSNGVEENALYGYTNRARINQKCVTVSARGTIGYAAIRETPFYPIVRLICVIPNNKLNVRFLKYYFDTLNFKVPTTGIPQLTVPMLKKYNVPVPSLAEQELIVKNLDKFDKLINDISEGIPAEIEARRKQYDYYRNKLLSFEVQDNDRTTK